MWCPWVYEYVRKEWSECMVCVMDINVMFWWMCVCSWSALIECGACSGGDFGVCGCVDVSECLWYVA